jgi:hypothetical protein
MKRILGVGLIGLLLIVVMISGCTTSSNAGKVLYESDVQTDGTTIFVPLDKQAVQVIVTEAKPYSSFSGYEPKAEFTSLQILSMNINGEDGQNAGNYASDITNSKYSNFEKTTTNTINIAAGTQCIALNPNQISAHIKVVTV